MPSAIKVRTSSNVSPTILHPLNQLHAAAKPFIDQLFDGFDSLLKTSSS